MKQLTSNSTPKGLNDNEVFDFQRKHDIELPKYFLDFVRKYGGTSTQEAGFEDSYWVNFFLPFSSSKTASVTAVFETYVIEQNTKSWLPFATDPGGWVFCISLEKNTEGQVWIDKFDSGDENQFDFVCSSFEQFINGLQPEQ